MLLLPLTPRTWDKCAGASPGTVDWSRELGTWPEDVCVSCLVPGALASQQGTLSGRLGSLVVPWPGPHGKHRLEESSWHPDLPLTSPRPLSPQRLFIL